MRRNQVLELETAIEAVLTSNMMLTQEEVLADESHPNVMGRTLSKEKKKRGSGVVNY